MAGPWRVLFVSSHVISRFGKPHLPTTRLRAQAALGYVPWTFFTVGDNLKAGVIAHCPYCGRMGPVDFTGEGRWDWNGDADTPTLLPSVLSREPSCGMHVWVRDGYIIDVATPPHGEG